MYTYEHMLCIHKRTYACIQTHGGVYICMCLHTTHTSPVIHIVTCAGMQRLTSSFRYTLALDVCTYVQNLLQYSYRSATIQLQICYNTATDLLQHSYRSATIQLQICYNTATDLLQYSYRSATTQLQICYNTATDLLQYRYKCTHITYSERKAEVCTILATIVCERHQQTFFVVKYLFWYPSEV